MIIASLLDELGTVTPVMSAIVAIATVYLRSFVKNELGDMQARIHLHLDTKYLGRDMIEMRLTSIERRINHMEESDHRSSREKL